MSERTCSIEAVEKRCPRCGEVKPLSDFWKRQKPNGEASTQPYCKPCGKALSKNWYQQDAGEAAKRKHHLRKRYGITPDGFEILLAEQGAGCAGCGRTQSTRKHLDVDHCHECSGIRGILCPDCNRAIGMLQEDPTVLRRLANYLESHSPHSQHPSAIGLSCECLFSTAG